MVGLGFRQGGGHSPDRESRCWAWDWRRPARPRWRSEAGYPRDRLPVLGRERRALRVQGTASGRGPAAAWSAERNSRSGTGPRRSATRAAAGSASSGRGDAGIPQADTLPGPVAVCMTSAVGGDRAAAVLSRLRADDIDGTPRRLPRREECDHGLRRLRQPTRSPARPATAR